MSIFQEIKNAISLKDIARFYGVDINRNDMCKCPFHNDKTPSMKIYDKGFACYGCGEKGDTIAFVAKMFNLDLYNAALKINEDFGLDITPQKVTQKEISNAQKLAEKRDTIDKVIKDTNDLMVTYFKTLLHFNTCYAPKNIGEQLDIRFVESLQNLEQTNYICNCFIEFSTNKEKLIDVISDFAPYIVQCRHRVAELSLDDKLHKKSLNSLLKKTKSVSLLPKDKPSKHNDIEL